MTFSIGFYIWTVVTMGLDVVLTILILGVALGLGLILRRLLVRRLEKTVLDNWIIQTFGVVAVVLPLALAGAGVPLIWHPELLPYYWYDFILPPFIGPKGQVITGFSVHLVETLLLIGLGIGAARTVRRLTVRGLGESHIDINIRTLIGRIFYYIVLLFAIFWILSIWQVSIAVPVTVISILTLAIAVSIQDILKDLVAGVYILIERPFHIGDEISTSNGGFTYVGTAEDVQLRATKLRLISGEEMTIPNSLVFGNIVVNNTFYSQRRATIEVKMPQEEFVKGETEAQILGALQEIPNVEGKPEPRVAFSHYADNDITLTVRFWIAIRKLSVVSDVMYTLHKTLPNAELTVQEAAGDV